MFILTNNKVVFTKGETIEKGRWENDPSMDTYRIKNGDEFQYAVIADFKLHEVEELPADFELNKYCYTEEEGFYENPEWIGPEGAIVYTEEYQAGYDQAVLDMINDGILKGEKK